MNLRIDAGGILSVQYSHGPSSPALRTGGRFTRPSSGTHSNASRASRTDGEAPTRAAALLETIVRLKPFEDYNGVIGAMCA